jgi:hypothetical protein
MISNPGKRREREKKGKMLWEVWPVTVEPPKKNLCVSAHMHMKIKIETGKERKKLHKMYLTKNI